MIQNCIIWLEIANKNSAGAATFSPHKSTLYPIKVTDMPNFRILLLSQCLKTHTSTVHCEKKSPALCY